MTRDQIAHILRAAAAITDQTEFVVVGSQAAVLLAEALPARMTESTEADIYPLRQPGLADVIDATIGELSLFHDTFGYYAQGVGPETAKLPAGWEGRARHLTHPTFAPATAIVPELTDLCAAKLIAMRPKDRDYVQAALSAGAVTAGALAARISTIPDVPSEAISAARAWLAGAGRD